MKISKNYEKIDFLFFDPKPFPGVPGAPGPIFRGPGPPKGAGGLTKPNFVKNPIFMVN